MANMKINAGDEYSLKLAKFGKDSAEIAKKVVMAGANIVADEIRKNLEENLRDPSYAGTGEGDFKHYKYTGDLLDSFGIAPPGPDSKGNTNTKIGFKGYDRRNIPNVLKARAMESGTSRLRKRPFVQPAVTKMKKKAIEEMGKTLNVEMTIYDL